LLALTGVAFFLRSYNIIYNLLVAILLYMVTLTRAGKSILDKALKINNYLEGLLVADKVLRLLTLLVNLMLCFQKGRIKNG